MTSIVWDFAAIAAARNRINGVTPTGRTFNMDGTPAGTAWFLCKPLQELKVWSPVPLGEVWVSADQWFDPEPDGA